MHSLITIKTRLQLYNCTNLSTFRRSLNILLNGHARSSSDATCFHGHPLSSRCIPEYPEQLTTPISEDLNEEEKSSAEVNECNDVIIGSDVNVKNGRNGSIGSIADRSHRSDSTESFEDYIVRSPSQLAAARRLHSPKKEVESPAGTEIDSIATPKYVPDDKVSPYKKVEMQQQNQTEIYPSVSNNNSYAAILEVHACSGSQFRKTPTKAMLMKTLSFSKPKGSPS